MTGLIVEVAGQSLGIEHHQILFKRFRLCQHTPVGADYQTRSIEDQAVVTANLIAHDYRNFEICSDGLQHLQPNFPFVYCEWRSRDIDDEIAPGADQLFYRID